ncbi:reverse transcriptase domain-containing protein, partial [Tanacetum coccineum]
FEENVSHDDLMEKKIMKFRLGGNTHTFTLLEFARALGLYNREEFADRHFKYYFKSGVRDDSQFREEKYWVSVSSEDSVRLSRTWADLYRPQDEDYVQRAMIHYQIDTGIPFKLRHCWEVLKDLPKWQEITIPTFKTGSEGSSKRHQSTGSSSFNTESGEASINLNSNVGDNDEDDV